MDLTLITAPAVEVVTLQEVKDHLRIEDLTEDTLIQAYLDAAIQRVDGRAGMLRRALVTQTWEMRLDNFPAGDEIRFPLPPLQSVVSVKYLDTNNVEQTFASSNYDVVTSELIGSLHLLRSKNWPVAYDERNAVRIRFTAGYGATASVVPAAVRVAIMMLAGELYAQRGDDGGSPSAVVNTLLAPYRIVEFENAGVLT